MTAQHMTIITLAFVLLASCSKLVDDKRPDSDTKSATNQDGLGTEFADFMASDTNFHDTASASKFCVNKPAGFLTKTIKIDGTTEYGICLGRFSLDSVNDVFHDGTHKFSYAAFRFSRFGDGTNNKKYIGAYSYTAPSGAGSIGVIAITISAAGDQDSFSCDFGDMKDFTVRTGGGGVSTIGTPLTYPRVGCYEKNLTMNSQTTGIIIPPGFTEAFPLNLVNVQ